MVSKAPALPALLVLAAFVALAAFAPTATADPEPGSYPYCLPRTTDDVPPVAWSEECRCPVPVLGAPPALCASVEAVEDATSCPPLLVGGRLNEDCYCPFPGPDLLGLCD